MKSKLSIGFALIPLAGVGYIATDGVVNNANIEKCQESNPLVRVISWQLEPRLIVATEDKPLLITSESFASYSFSYMSLNRRFLERLNIDWGFIHVEMPFDNGRVKIRNVASYHPKRSEYQNWMF
ncbi:MAG: hypothetical protein MI867_26495 [Pseudomonadales bacterium]|nr:hypothetical protein [Pseudomonadales bacterium]